MTTMYKISADTFSFQNFQGATTPGTGISSYSFRSWGNGHSSSWSGITINKALGFFSTTSSTGPHLLCTALKGAASPPGYKWNMSQITYPAPLTAAGTTSMYTVAATKTRLWFAHNVFAGNIYYRVSEDLTAMYATPGVYNAAISNLFGPFSPSYTYNAVGYTFDTERTAFVPTDNNSGLLLKYEIVGGVLTIFAISMTSAGTAPVFYKCFQAPLIVNVLEGANNGILATYPYSNGGAQRYLTLIRTAAGLQKVDWSPTAITNTVFDANITPLVMSSAADQAIVVARDKINVATTDYGVFLSFYTGVANDANFYQIDPSLSYYREIIPQNLGVPNFSVDSNIIPDDNGYLCLTLGDGLSTNPMFATSEYSASMSFPKVRAFGFSLDSHDYWAVTLGTSETLLYDATTQQWSEWDSATFNTWRANYGLNWLGYKGGPATDVIAGDSNTGTLWSFDPDQGYDNTQTPGSDVDISTKVTAGFPYRGRGGSKANAIFLSLRTGNPSVTPGTVSLRTSDDNGQTFTEQGTITLPVGEYDQEVVWRSLGLMKAPGRIFEFYDNGASVRFDSVDLYTDGENG